MANFSRVRGVGDVFGVHQGVPRIGLVGIVLGLVLRIGLGISGHTLIAESLDTEDRLESKGTRVWQEEFGSSVGGGIGMKVFGADEAHDFGLAKFHYGWNRSRLYFSERWYRGEFGFFQEMMAGGQVDPEAAYLVGLTPILKYRFRYWDRFRPFLDGGAGVMLTDIGLPSLGSKFEFYEQFGLGFDWKRSEKMSLTAQARFAHLSNAGIRIPNRGLNSTLLFVGANWQF